MPEDERNKIAKVGILTFHHSHYNYGAVLQTFSIYKIVESLGYKPYIINYIPQVSAMRKKIAAKVVALLGFEFNNFRKRYIPGILHKTENLGELKKLNSFIDGFVVGSDQVWRNRTDSNSVFKYYLNFVNEEKPKIAFAASFGIDLWEANTEVTEVVKKLIKRFDAISVREESGIKICEEIFDVESISVLDPTLLIDQKLFEKMTAKKDKAVPNSKYMAYMLLDNSNENKKFFKDTASKHNLKFTPIGGKKIWPRKGLFFYKSVELWLSYLKNAELIVTDSFHCTVFAILFRKNFICLANPHRGVTRLNNLLNILDLDSQLYTNISQIETETILKKINYETVQSALEKEQQKSIRFLKDSLSMIKV